MKWKDQKGREDNDFIWVDKRTELVSSASARGQAFPRDSAMIIDVVLGCSGWPHVGLILGQVVYLAVAVVKTSWELLYDRVSTRQMLSKKFQSPQLAQLGPNHHQHMRIMAPARLLINWDLSKHCQCWIKAYIMSWLFRKVLRLEKLRTAGGTFLAGGRPWWALSQSPLEIEQKADTLLFVT